MLTEQEDAEVRDAIVLLEDVRDKRLG